METFRRRRRVVLALLALVIGGSVVSASFYLSSAGGRDSVIQAGIVQSGDRPLIYFTLFNPTSSNQSYVYRVSNNSTGSPFNLGPTPVTVLSRTSFEFRAYLTANLTQNVLVKMTVYNYTTPSEPRLVFNQTWIVRVA